MQSESNSAVMGLLFDILTNFRFACKLFCIASFHITLFFIRRWKPICVVCLSAELICPDLLYICYGFNLRHQSVSNIQAVQNHRKMHENYWSICICSIYWNNSWDLRIFGNPFLEAITFRMDFFFNARMEAYQFFRKSFSQNLYEHNCWFNYKLYHRE